MYEMSMHVLQPDLSCADSKIFENSFAFVGSRHDQSTPEILPCARIGCVAATVSVDVPK